MKIYRRNRWNPAGGRGSRDEAKREGFLHWTVTDGSRLNSLAEQAAHMRMLERIHLNNGWVGLGYNYVVFQPHSPLRRARTFEGRGASYIPAAQAGHNRGTIAVAVVMRPGDKLSLATKWELVRVFRWLRREKGIQRLRGHRDENSTACPGDVLYALLPWLRRKTYLRS